MAGRLPGVGLSPRKRSENYHNRHEHYATYRDSYLKESLDAPWTSMTTTLDETAFKAKQRLQKKLGHFFSSSRYIKSYIIIQFFYFLKKQEIGYY